MARMPLLASVAVLVAALLVAARVPAMELEAGVGSMGGACCNWWLVMRADGVATVKVTPAAHLSRTFALSAEARRELRNVLSREGFFSLPQELGDLVVDGDGAQITVRDAGRKHTVRLNALPTGLEPVWRQEPGAIGRALRICEYLRDLTGVPEARHCPGVEDSK